MWVFLFVPPEREKKDYTIGCKKRLWIAYESLRTVSEHSQSVSERLWGFLVDYIVNSFTSGFLQNFVSYIRMYTTHWRLPLFKISTYCTYVGLGLCGAVWPAFWKWFTNQLTKIWTFMWRRGQGWHESALCKGLWTLRDHTQRIRKEFITFFCMLP